MTVASRWLRRLEIALWFSGLALVGVALGATFVRWNYQTEQERALFAGAAPDVRAAEPHVVTRPDPRTELIGPIPVLVKAAPPSSAIAEQDAGIAPRPEEARRTNAPSDPAAFGRIEIPRLGVSAMIRDGADEKTLARAVGLVPGAAHPGEPGNIVLAGHRDTFFRPLRKIKVNDRIRVVVPPNAYEYRVESFRVVTPEETGVLASKGIEELTLVTCYPFRFVGSAPDRFIVSATRVN
jgi:sortase A